MNEPFQTPEQPNAVHSVRFQSSKMGLFTVAREGAMMEDAETKAKAWIFEHRDQIEVVSISTALGQMSAVVTVWHR